MGETNTQPHPCDAARPQPMRCVCGCGRAGVPRLRGLAHRCSRDPAVRAKFPAAPPPQPDVCRHCGDRPPCRPRGLCARCYYLPGVRGLYESAQNRGHGTPADHAAAAWLFLAGWLMHRHHRSSLHAEDWEAVLRVVTPRERLVLVLRHFHGWPHDRVGEELGVSLERANQLDRAGLKRLRVVHGEGRLRELLSAVRGPVVA